MPEADGTTFPWTALTPGDFQEDIAVANGKITGTLKFIDGGLSPAGPLSGDGHFLAVKFTADDWTDYTSVKVGVNPSQGTGLVELINDPDKNGVFKITDNQSQWLEVVWTDGTNEGYMTYSLKDLVLESDEA